MNFPALNPVLILQPLDWVFIACFGLLMPVLGIRYIRAFRKRVAAGETDARVRSYRFTAAEQWLSTAILLIGWRYLDRPLAELGLTLPTHGGALLAWGLAVTGSLIMLVQMRSIAHSTSSRESLRQQMGILAPLMPASRRDLRYFSALSITAGINEEIVYRGFIMAVFWQLGGPWLALLASIAIFTLGHIYQPENLPKVAVIGLVMSFLYLLGGSVFPLMLLHAALDLAAGWMCWRIAQPEDGAPPQVPAGLPGTA